MSISRVTFENREGNSLSGILELPGNRDAHNFVLFAHCFTCNKNLKAASNISKALIEQGYGVLRFDFTGLGESEGDFEDTNFSGNVEDLIAASDYLSKNQKAPSLLIGHSLGGTASIFAASRIKSIRALATIGAPSNPVHVKNLMKCSLPEIEEKGKAIVNLSGRDFTIKKQFIDDLESHSLPQIIKNLEKPILVLHSPQDTIVGIKNAEEIYLSARHPKSFISLDGADHLLSRKKDSIYVGHAITGWASRYLEIPSEESILKSDHLVVARLGNLEKFTTQMKVGNHYMVADEPESFGGDDFGPSPYGYISAGLACCTTMTIKVYVARKGWDLKSAEVHVSHARVHKEDCENCEDSSAKIDTFYKEIKLEGNLSEEQITRIMQIADKCPVHRTFQSEIQIITKLVS
ncbi:bifunctional alpha/beta hydrolase/OsmC family protein [Aquimarina sp. 2304DJ70-9]|uniref:bifunctional alpha/beta hydrolase/OsmC family protein n=1 Tax=Aquimarina penaris TaxID=3231044 RepID=UPI0034621F0E